MIYFERRSGLVLYILLFVPSSFSSILDNALSTAPFSSSYHQSLNRAVILILCYCFPRCDNFTHKRQSISSTLILLLPASTTLAVNSDHTADDKDTNTENVLRQSETALDIVASY